MDPKIKSSLIGGAITGILASIPIVNMGCCLWAALGGAAGTYLYKQETGKKLELQNGAVIGGLTGVVGTIIATVIGLVLMLLFQGMSAGLSMMQGQMEAIPGLVAGGGVSIVYAIVMFFLNLVILGIFGIVGGLITAAALEE